MKARHIISVDPGDVHNGFCYFKQDENGVDLKVMEVLTEKGLSDMLRVIWGIGLARTDVDPKAKNPHNMFFIIENFRMDSEIRGAVFQWNELLTSQAIGKVKLCAEWMEAPIFMQEPGPILAQGRKWCPWKLPKGHIPDDKAAFIHGAHFILQKKLIRTVSEISLFGQRQLG